MRDFAPSLPYFFSSSSLKMRKAMAGSVDASLFGTTVQLVKEVMASNLEMMTAKIKEPALTADFKDVKSYTETLQGLIDTTNEAIRVNNEMVDNFSNEQSSLIKDVWYYLGAPVV